MSRVLILGLFFLGISAVAWCGQSDYDGAYAGTYSGSEDGIWIAVLDSSDENVFLAYSPDTENVDVGNLDYWGEPSSGVGSFYTEYTSIHGSEIDIYVDSSDGSVTGTWENVDESGDIEGELFTSVDYDGDYSGTFTGDDSGTWVLTIDEDGYVSGTMETDDGDYDFEGVCHPDGYLIVAGDTGDVEFLVFGSISGPTVTGHWITEDDDSGTISGTADGADGGTTTSTAGGGGGGGCFISSLAGE